MAPEASRSGILGERVRRGLLTSLLVWPAGPGRRTIGTVMRLCDRPLPWMLVALLAFAGGCGGGHDAMEKQLAELRSEVTKLRASQAALNERLDNIEIARGSFTKDAPAADAGQRAPEGDRPPLDVVRLAPGQVEGDADSEAPRPVIRAVG